MRQKEAVARTVLMEKLKRKEIELTQFSLSKNLKEKIEKRKRNEKENSKRHDSENESDSDSKMKDKIQTKKNEEQIDKTSSCSFEIQQVHPIFRQTSFSSPKFRISRLLGASSYSFMHPSSQTNSSSPLSPSLAETSKSPCSYSLLDLSQSSTSSSPWDFNRIAKASQLPLVPHMFQPLHRRFPSSLSDPYSLVWWMRLMSEMNLSYKNKSDNDDDGADIDLDDDSSYMEIDDENNERTGKTMEQEQQRLALRNSFAICSQGDCASLCLMNSRTDRRVRLMQRRKSNRINNNAFIPHDFDQSQLHPLYSSSLSSLSLSSSSSFIPRAQFASNPFFLLLSLSQNSRTLLPPLPPVSLPLFISSKLTNKRFDVEYVKERRQNISRVSSEIRWKAQTSGIEVGVGEKWVDRERSRREWRKERRRQKSAWRQQKNERKILLKFYKDEKSKLANTKAEQEGDKKVVDENSGEASQLKLTENTEKLNFNISSPVSNIVQPSKDSVVSFSDESSLSVISPSATLLSQLSAKQESETDSSSSISTPTFSSEETDDSSCAALGMISFTTRKPLVNYRVRRRKKMRRMLNNLWVVDEEHSKLVNSASKGMNIIIEEQRAEQEKKEMLITKSKRNKSTGKKEVEKEQGEENCAQNRICNSSSFASFLAKSDSSPVISRCVIPKNSSSSFSVQSPTFQNSVTSSNCSSIIQSPRLGSSFLSSSFSSNSSFSPSSTLTSSSMSSSNTSSLSFTPSLSQSTKCTYFSTVEFPHMWIKPLSSTKCNHSSNDQVIPLSSSRSSLNSSAPLVANSSASTNSLNLQSSLEELLLKAQSAFLDACNKEKKKEHQRRSRNRRSSMRRLQKSKKQKMDEDKNEEKEDASFGDSKILNVTKRKMVSARQMNNYSKSDASPLKTVENESTFSSSSLLSSSEYSDSSPSSSETSCSEPSDFRKMSVARLVVNIDLFNTLTAYIASTAKLPSPPSAATEAKDGNISDSKNDSDEENNNNNALLPSSSVPSWLQKVANRKKLLSSVTSSEPSSRNFIVSGQSFSFSGREKMIERVLRERERIENERRVKLNKFGAWTSSRFADTERLARAKNIVRRRKEKKEQKDEKNKRKRNRRKSEKQTSKQNDSCDASGCINMMQIDCDEFSFDSSGGISTFLDESSSSPSPSGSNSADNSKKNRFSRRPQFSSSVKAKSKENDLSAFYELMKVEDESQIRSIYSRFLSDKHFRVFLKKYFSQNNFVNNSSPNVSLQAIEKASSSLKSQSESNMRNDFSVSRVVSTIPRSLDSSSSIKNKKVDHDFVRKVYNLQLKQRYFAGSRTSGSGWLWNPEDENYWDDVTGCWNICDYFEIFGYLTTERTVPVVHSNSILKTIREQQKTVKSEKSMFLVNSKTQAAQVKRKIQTVSSILEKQSPIISSFSSATDPSSQSQLKFCSRRSSQQKYFCPMQPVVLLRSPILFVDSWAYVSSCPPLHTTFKWSNAKALLSEKEKKLGSKTDSQSSQKTQNCSSSLIEQSKPTENKLSLVKDSYVPVSCASDYILSTSELHPIAVETIRLKLDECDGTCLNDVDCGSKAFGARSTDTKQTSYSQFQSIAGSAVSPNKSQFFNSVSSLSSASSTTNELNSSSSKPVQSCSSCSSCCNSSHFSSLLSSSIFQLSTASPVLAEILEHPSSLFSLFPTQHLPIITVFHSFWTEASDTEREIKIELNRIQNHNIDKEKGFNEPLLNQKFATRKVTENNEDCYID
eukprot:MONOS_11997.1-p1 / transcript=MONOS_11997.1 / gene=MONOS_11997 / organism=Monocercomonoides_exilis_PA203 / gene_product=unspecified product / transcript_product=unspecified product / location=Mono_scaffold00634:18468-24032(+) / protein_length=1735 / sequence_SO=supercontig / SO=protein_coding / is_pseudo=false